jgi:putative acyl-CoA dehydrogenase
MDSLQTAFPAQMSNNAFRTAVSDFALSSSSQMIHEHAFLAHSNPPVLSTHDRTGIRRDQVDYHPSYHRLMAFGVESRVPSFA